VCSVLTYAFPVRGNAANICIHKLQTFQKKFLRIIITFPMVMSIVTLSTDRNAAREMPYEDVTEVTSSSETARVNGWNTANPSRLKFWVSYHPLAR
jgi:hypothetical protein